MVRVGNRNTITFEHITLHMCVDIDTQMEMYPQSSFSASASRIKRMNMLLRACLHMYTRKRMLHIKTNVFYFCIYFYTYYNLMKTSLHQRILFLAKKLH